jgi:hydrogenase maturation protease
MNRTLVDRIADAVLYEGYILYPYRPSVKNRRRWTFGGLYPEIWCQAQGGETSSSQTECLVQGGTTTAIEVVVRFLHLTARRIEEGTGPPFRQVEELRVGEQVFQSWQEAEEREAAVGKVTLGTLAVGPRTWPFTFLGRCRSELLHGPQGEVVGAQVREQHPIAGVVRLAAAQVEAELFRLTVRVENLTPLDDAGRRSREDALLCALVSTHAILGVRDGEFISLLDPPDQWREAAAACRNVGTWPVLVGEEGQKNLMLSSPIILYDYPQVAPESPGDFFDGTEIDEMLTLRILTLTEDEKHAMAAVDERARGLLARTEALAREQLLGLHGTMRGLRLLPEEDTHGQLGS